MKIKCLLKKMLAGILKALRRILPAPARRLAGKAVRALFPKTAGHLERVIHPSSQVAGNWREDYYQEHSVAESLRKVDPKGILSYGRLDLVVRYLLFRDLVYGRENPRHLSLYSRQVLARTGGVEPTSYYSEDGKVGLERHLEAARELLESMKRNGFQKENYVPIASDYGLYNGAHRLAAAMALNEDAWVRVCGEHGIKDFTFDWFCDNGFTRDDKIEILRGFAELHEKCGIFVLYAPCEDKWDYIQTYIGRKMQIVGYVDLDFSNDFIAFENLVRDIYLDYGEESVIARKIDLLAYAKPILRVILVSDEMAPEDDLYRTIQETKGEIRNLMDPDVAKNGFVTLHASDTHEEEQLMMRVLLSVNNLRYLGMRVKPCCRRQFLGWLRDYMDYMRRHGIDIADTCIVGSSPLEVVGIRDSTDIDIVVSAELRRTVGDGVTHLTPNLDIGTRNYVRDGEKVLIKDEQLIYDDSCHFIFMGCKFANVEHVLCRKKGSDRDKDIRDTKLIEIYFNYIKNFDDRKVLQEQIAKEVARRNLGRKRSGGVNEEKIKAGIRARYRCVLTGFGRGRFYQSFPLLGIDGQRPTEYRLSEYGLYPLLDGTEKVLDIGCNCGFLDMTIADKVRSVMGIEYNKGLVKVGNYAARKLGIMNVTFIAADFNKWAEGCTESFDIIFSFAVHVWLGVTPEGYAAVLGRLVSDGGLLFFESNNIESNDKDYEKFVIELYRKGFALIKEGTIKDDNIIFRKFKVLRKTGKIGKNIKLGG